jgi:hypothetical protein
MALMGWHIIPNFLFSVREAQGLIWQELNAKGKATF